MLKYLVGTQHVHVCILRSDSMLRYIFLGGGGGGGEAGESKLSTSCALCTTVPVPSPFVEVPTFLCNVLIFFPFILPISIPSSEASGFSATVCCQERQLGDWNFLAHKSGFPVEGLPTLTAVTQTANQ